MAYKPPTNIQPEAKPTFEVEKGVAPPTDGRTGSAKKYPWHDMEIGDSFFVPFPAGTVQKLSAAAHGAIHTQPKLYGRRYRTATIKDEHGNKTGVRVWRVA